MEQVFEQYMIFVIPLKLINPTRKKYLSHTVRYEDIQGQIDRQIDRYLTEFLIKNNFNCTIFTF